jgi:hypothetical protein
LDSYWFRIFGGFLGLLWMKKILLLLFLSLGLIACSEKEPELDYSISNGKFYTSYGEVPAECIANLMTELNGDNNVASIYLNRCINSNIPYLYHEVNEGDIRYTIEKELKNHQYRLKVCQKVYASLGGFCDEIIVQFSNRDYEKFGFDNKNILVLDKIGDRK